MDVSTNQQHNTPVSSYTSTDENVTPHMNTAKEQTKQAAKDIVFGSFAGIVGKVIEYPFDTVKVRLQAQPDHGPLLYNGPLDCFRQSLKKGGVAGLYRGISAPLLGAAVETSSLFFSVCLHISCDTGQWG